jgi:hypothetical protein
MKSLLIKNAAILVSIIAMTSANAEWQCKIHNARGKVWFETGQTRKNASANAMKICARHSAFAANCILDYCKPKHHGGGSNGGYTKKLWQCQVNNARGQQFVGTGQTQSLAAANATGACAANSRFAKNCVLQNCFKR